MSACAPARTAVGACVCVQLPRERERRRGARATPGALKYAESFISLVQLPLTVASLVAREQHVNCLPQLHELARRCSTMRGALHTGFICMHGDHVT